MKLWFLLLFSLLFSLLSATASAQVSLPVSLQSFQIQQLINKSEQQVKTLTKILNYQKQNSVSLRRASQVLEKLSNGLNDSIEKYKGTSVYERALIDLQSQKNFSETYEDSQNVNREVPKQPRAVQTEIDREMKSLIKFQKDSVEANQSDLTQQKNLQSALNSAPQGFIPKIQTEAQLGSWKTNTRLSAQLTQLLGSVQAMREELRERRMKEQNSNVLSEFIKGTDLQNEKLREGRAN